MNLFYPVKNKINPNNLFGTPGAMYTALNQKGHPGIDFECPYGTPIYSPCDGAAFYVTDPEGGDGLWIRIPDNLPDVEATVILWHMVPKNTDGFPYSIPTDGSLTQVKAGQLLGYSGNSGFPAESTGPHLHFGLIPCDKFGGALYSDNGYKGCVDPVPYFNGHYAQDIQAIQSVVSAVQSTASSIASSPDVTPEQKLNWIQELYEALKKLW